MGTSYPSENNDSFKDRRKDPRVLSEIPIKIFQEDGDILTETKNISRSGAYCRVNRYMSPMTKLRINLLLPVKQTGKIKTSKISCEGIVVRTEPIDGDTSYNAAIFFNNISQKDSDAIAQYVNNYLSER